MRPVFTGRVSERCFKGRPAAMKWMSTGFVAMFAIFALFFFAGPAQERRDDSAGAAALAHIKVGMSFGEAQRSLIRTGLNAPKNWSTNGLHLPGRLPRSPHQDARRANHLALRHGDISQGSTC